MRLIITVSSSHDNKWAPPQPGRYLWSQLDSIGRPFDQNSLTYRQGREILEEFVCMCGRDELVVCEVSHPLVHT